MLDSNYLPKIWNVTQNAFPLSHSLIVAHVVRNTIIMILRKLYFIIFYLKGAVHLSGGQIFWVV